MSEPDSRMLHSIGTTCGHCGGAPEVQWQRRPTPGELAVLVAAAEARRAEILALADPQQPPPVFGPLPAYETTSVAVYACREHAVHAEHASRVHLPDCSAPHVAHLPECDCEPEPHPDPVPLSVPKALTATGWVLPAA